LFAAQSIWGPGAPAPSEPMEKCNEPPWVTRTLSLQEGGQLDKGPLF